MFLVTCYPKVRCLSSSNCFECHSDLAHDHTVSTCCLFWNMAEDDKQLNYFRVASEETKHHLAEMKPYENVGKFFSLKREHFTI